MSLVRSIMTVGGYTMASRVLGFIRDILIARVLGTGLAADAFFVSQRFPNLFRSLFAEGAFNAAFVPQFAKRLESDGKESARRYAEEVMAVLSAVLLLVTVLAEAGMPWLMYGLAGGYADNPQKFALSVALTQITFPYLYFIALTALQGGVLNSLHQYAHAAAAPILLNVVMIIALVVFAPLLGFPAHVLAVAMTIAGIGQFLWMVIACRRAGMPLGFAMPRITPDIRKLFGLMLPGIIGSGVMQINLVIGTQIASWQDSAVSYLYYADRIYQLPLAVIGSATGVVLLPELSRHLRAGRVAEGQGAINRGIEFTLLLVLPAAAALAVLAWPIITVLFERGAFTAEDSRATALALAIYAFGLPAFVLVKPLTAIYFAHEDTRTPFRFAVVSMVVNTLLSVGFFFVIGFAGIAAATVIASWLNITMLSRRLVGERWLAFDARLKGRLAAMVASSIGMGAAVWYAAQQLAPHFTALFVERTGALAAVVLGGMMLFGLLALITGATRLDELRLRRRRAH